MKAFIWLLPIGLILFAWRFPRAATRGAVLRVLSVSLDSGLSAGRLLNALGRESGFWERRSLQKLAECFDEGLTVAQSLESMGTYFPIDLQAELRVAEACGTLPEAVRRTTDEWEMRASRSLPPWERLFLYLAGVSIVVWGIITFMDEYIVPKMLRIAEDLQMTNVEGTDGGNKPAWIMGISPWARQLGNTWRFADFIFLVVGCGIVVCSIPGLYHWWTGQRYDSVWRGLLSRLFPRLDTPLLLRVFRPPILAGLPLKIALDQLEVHHPQVSLRKKIRKLNEETEAGGSLWESMLEMKLLNSRELGLIRSAETRGHLPWVLTELADELDARRRNRFVLAGELAQPLGVLLLAIPVLGIAAGVIQFLVLLIDKM